MFKQAKGFRYGQFMGRLHRQFLFDWYLEVGCRKGRVFAPVRGKTIAVDPFFLIETNVVTTKPQLHIFQQTSDDFFQNGFLEAMKIKLSFSFLDGMHLFEFLLRDFMAAEKASAVDVADLQAILAHQRDCLGDAQAFVAADVAFHTRIAAMTGNPIMLAVSEAMLKWLFHYHSALLHWSGKEAVTLQEHALIIARIAANDAPGAVAAMQAHIARSADVIGHHG